MVFRCWRFGWGDFTNEVEWVRLVGRLWWRVHRLVECPVCNGGGFSGYGRGYDDVCSECGGRGKLLEW
jgi:hypothetical protein